MRLTMSRSEVRGSYLAPLTLDVLPLEILSRIFNFCDSSSLRSLSMVNKRLAGVIAPLKLQFHDLPVDVVLKIFSYLDRSSLGSAAQVNRRFRDLSYANCLWLRAARECLVTNGKDEGVRQRTSSELSARDRVWISRNWSKGWYTETKLLVQKHRYMPRLQLEKNQLWVSWGNHIWAHPRNARDGTINRRTTRVLRGHTDDVSRFVVRDGWLVSGGRDSAIVGWNASSGEFLFAKRHCHSGEISAIDVLASSNLVISGSRDRTMKLWAINPNCLRDGIDHQDLTFPVLIQTINIGDRIWSLSVNAVNGLVVVGSAGLGGVPALHIIDLPSFSSTRIPLLHPLGSQLLKKGAGTLDLQWHTENTFVSCGYDTFARLWDTRVGSCVRTWEEPFDEAIYCLCTDNNMSLICGTARHGLVRLWDMRHSQPVQMFYAKHAHLGQSSPVYSVAFDQANLYVALDQCLNLLSFRGYRNRTFQ